MSSKEARSSSSALATCETLKARGSRSLVGSCQSTRSVWAPGLAAWPSWDGREPRQCFRLQPQHSLNNRARRPGVSPNVGLPLMHTHGVCGVTPPPRGVSSPSTAMGWRVAFPWAKGAPVVDRGVTPQRCPRSNPQDLCVRLFTRTGDLQV